MARTRNTKRLAQRLDREYFKRPHPLRTWRRRLALAAVAVAVGVTAWGLTPARRMMWSRGELSAAHAFIRDDCGACHGPPRVPADKLGAVAGQVHADELVPLGSSSITAGGVS